MINKKQYKILSIHWGFSLGGVAKYAELMENVSTYRDIKIKSVCIHGKDWVLDESTMSGLDIQSILINSKLDFSWLKSLKKIIEAEKPDAVITHGFNGHFVYWLTSCFTSENTLWLASYHGEYHGNSSLRKFAGLFLNALTIYLFRKHVNNIVSVASYSKDHLVRNGVKSTKIDVIHNGIPLQDIDDHAGQNLRQEWGVNDNEILIGVISRLDPVKGIEYLIDAFSKTKQNHNNLKFVIIGTGSITSELQKRVDKLGLNNSITFAGYRSDVQDCLAALDLFVLPSLAEYHSIALLEAMRARKAIISTDVGGNTESVRDGIEAIVVPSADSQALYHALEKMVSDKELRNTLAGNARIRFESEFSSDVMIEKTADWLYGCVSGTESN